MEFSVLLTLEFSNTTKTCLCHCTLGRTLPYFLFASRPFRQVFGELTDATPLPKHSMVVSDIDE